MNIYTFSGSSLTESFALAGQRLVAAYDLSGKVIWQAEALDKNFAGSYTKWQFRKDGEADWQTVTIPHDWSIRNNFNAKSPSTYEGGYLDGGDAWYQTSFEVPAVLKTKRTLLYFDGVYMESTVTLNGVELGKNYNGYNPFWFDVTDKLVNGINYLTVFVRSKQPSSRWYSGSGIYRPVYLLATESSGYAADKLAITSPNLEAEHAGTVQTTVSCKLYNFGAAGSKTVKISIRKSGTEVAQTSKAVTLVNGANDVSMTVGVSAPMLWDIGKPNLYTAVVLVGGTEIGSSVFGYRYTKWDVDTGFWLNGKNLKIKGVCMHHDLGCIGAEVNKSAMERQIDSMVEMGANAIRLTHNPSSTLFLELCRDTKTTVAPMQWRTLAGCMTNGSKSMISFKEDNDVNIIQFQRGDKTALTKDFKRYEFQCPCGCGTQVVDPELAEKLQIIRDKVGKPLKITSGYRCIKHNAAAGGSSGSKHRYGMAADWRLVDRSINPVALGIIAQAVGFGGIGIYWYDGNAFCHADTRGAKATWLCDAKKHYPSTTYNKFILPTIRKGCTGDVNKTATKLLQRLLGLMPDGIFGEDTENALMKAQSAHHITADGICGQASWKALSGADKYI